jgi:hypothetical protein
MDETTRMSLAARLTRIWHWKASETEAEFERGPTQRPQRWRMRSERNTARTRSKS